MFTGIIEEVGHISGIKNGASSVRLTIAAKKILTDVGIGDSIAVNGTCLTVTQYTDKSFSADVMPESVRKTSLGELKQGSLVNLERALKVGSRLGGHIVSGHIDGTGTIIEKKPEDNAVIVTISVDKGLLRYIVKKGSVTIDGISLTVVDADYAEFSVSLIPHTASITTIGQKNTGASVNIETDILGKYVEKMLLMQKAESPQLSKINAEFLSENGF
ncbi:riboflavin synthase [Pectinatus haikarae]|uniref:Riboflavin synthase n=1 Tax=Pectinatus haikarae TaxID=349096 RepID=A0ABT9Y8M3_9FIRM|nr:riboflavin synthase [Pectinatus haikarae]MDQ0203517.1 riboflavin synthase [Pectinatus haikarae]